MIYGALNRRTRAERSGPPDRRSSENRSPFLGKPRTPGSARRLIYRINPCHIGPRRHSAIMSARLFGPANTASTLSLPRCAPSPAARARSPRVWSSSESRRLERYPDQDVTDDIAHLSLQSEKVGAALFCSRLGVTRFSIR